MPSCRNCGSYTKYYNGLCYSCYKNKGPKAGRVYIAEVTFPSGKKTIYTGQTKRPLSTRLKEHKHAQEIGNTKTYTGRGIGIKVLGSFFSRNSLKAEKTVKGLTREAKISLAKRFRKR